MARYHKVKGRNVRENCKINPKELVYLKSKEFPEEEEEEE